MDKGSPDAENTSKEVTIVISRKVKPGYDKEYDEWLRRYLMLEKKVPGYVGATIITQGGTASAIRHIIYRFSDKASLDAWENSEARKQCVYDHSQQNIALLSTRNKTLAKATAHRSFS